MASEIAKAVVGSKFKEITGGLEGALGVGSEEEETARTKDAQRKVDKERAKKQEEREIQKRELHSQKELERQKIREKYGVKTGNVKSSAKTNTHSGDSSTAKEGTCSVC